jgi:hypothetical protein
MRTIYSLLTLTITVAATAAFSAACNPSFDANTSLDTNVEFTADLSGACTGSGTITSADGKSVTKYTKETLANGDCSIAMDWNGQLVDTGSIHQKIQQEADEKGVTLNDVTLVDVTVTIDNAVLQDHSGAAITPPRVPSFAAHVDVSSNEVFTMSGQALSALLAQPLSVDLPPPVLTAANDALKNMTPLAATGQGTLVVAAADLMRLAATAAPAQIAFQIHLDIKARGSVKLF